MRTFSLKSGVLGFCLLSHAIHAELTPLIVPTLNGNKYVGKSVIADSIDNVKQKFRDRSYYYDFDVDESGRALVIYAMPKPHIANSTAGIAYSEKSIADNETSEIWLAVETETGWNKIPITGNGAYTPTGLHLQVDSRGVAHLIYIEKRSVVLGTETKVQDYLMYRTFQDGILSAEVMVGDLPKGNVAGLGGWRTYMAISPDNKVYLLREGASEKDANKPAFKLLIPNGQGNWTATEIAFSNLPASNWYHLGKFIIDSRGEAHIVFGDFAYNRNGQKYQATGERTVDKLGYHNLWYASSKTLDGQGWTAFQLDEDLNNPLPTLYEQEFWLDLIVDAQHNPSVATWVHPVGTNEMKHNTSGFMFYRDSAGKWQGNRTTRIFDASYTYKGKGWVEGMGAGLAKDQYGWHGVWDSSHSRPIEHESPRGGLIYRFSPDGKDWTNYQLLAEFSGEGSSLVKIDKQNRLNVLVLGDHTDTQLYFLRYQLPDNNLMEVSPDRKFYYNGETVSLNAQVRNGAVGDFYVAVVGEARPEIQQPQEIWQLTSSFNWEKISNFNQLKPVVSLAQGISFNGQISAIASKQPPFKNPDTNYTIYSVVARQGTNVLNGQWTTPLFSRQLIANKTLPSQ